MTSGVWRDLYLVFREDDLFRDFWVCCIEFVGKKVCPDNN